MPWSSSGFRILSPRFPSVWPFAWSGLTFTRFSRKTANRGGAAGGALEEGTGILLGREPARGICGTAAKLRSRTRTAAENRDGLRQDDPAQLPGEEAPGCLPHPRCLRHGMGVVEGLAGEHAILKVLVHFRSGSDVYPLHAMSDHVSISGNNSPLTGHGRPRQWTWTPNRVL